MIARVVAKEERVATERLQKILAAIDGLQDVERERVLNRTQKAALSFLESIYIRGVRYRGAYISDDLVRQPLAVARRATEVHRCR